ncbi:short-chain dehydrogenase [Pseudoalteromonas sp. AOP31-A2-14]|uniref:short-chain dehydrogenase n=1 Tax=unclassified Pseudoalteromonas TaxID=194690 RepID=UPI003F9CB956
MKKILLSLGLLAMSFSSIAEDITESELQGYMEALPAVAQWSQDQPALDNLNLASMLGSSEGNSSMATSALSMLKDNDLYKQFSALTAEYGFTPEEFVSVGSEVSMAYLENLKSGLSDENKAKVNELMGGIKSSGNSSASSASSMMSSLGGSTSTADSSTEVSESNVSLVQEYMPQLQKLFAMVK